MPAGRSVTRAKEWVRLLPLLLVTALLLVTFLFLEASDLISHTGGV
ncbi:MAG: hypothetical protein ABR525_00765 [Candidatus Limnocylindria bacterium]